MNDFKRTPAPQEQQAGVTTLDCNAQPASCRVIGISAPGVVRKRLLEPDSL